MAEVKKYRCEVRETQSRPGVYPLVKGWLEKNSISYSEGWVYSGKRIRVDLTLYEVSMVLDLLNEYGVINDDQNQLTVGF